MDTSTPGLRIGNPVIKITINEYVSGRVIEHAACVGYTCWKPNSLFPINIHGARAITFPASSFQSQWGKKTFIILFARRCFSKQWDRFAGDSETAIDDLRTKPKTILRSYQTGVTYDFGAAANISVTSGNDHYHRHVPRSSYTFYNQTADNRPKVPPESSRSTRFDFSV